MTTETEFRVLLEQAREALDLSRRFVYQDSRPQVDAAFDALNAELAKPVERVEPITLDQFRAIAHRTATTYRHRSDPEKSSYAFVDGSSLDDFWRKVCEAIQPTSAWHDAPEVAALKAQRDVMLDALKAFSDYVHTEQCSADGKVTYSDSRIQHLVFKARDAIAKAEGGAA